MQTNGHETFTPLPRRRATTDAIAAIQEQIRSGQLAPGVVAAIADAARSGNESGDGLVWTSPVGNVTHHRTGKRLEEVEKR